MCPLARAAALGLMLGACAPAGGPAPSQPETIVVPSVPAVEDDPSDQPLVAAQPERGGADTDAAEGKSCCKGLNECKGQGNCKTELSGCAGMNDCKGKGGCAGHCPR